MFGPAPAPPSTAFVVADRQLLEVDVVTGATVRVVIEDFDGDGVFRGNLRLSRDRSTLWFSEGYEDGWFGCESSVGSYGRVDLDRGEVEVVGVGTGAEPSPDGSSVAFVSSGICLPDPDNPDQWVLTPADRVVVRDLESERERVYVSEPSPGGLADPSRVDWVGYTPQGAVLVLTADGDLRMLDLDGSNVIQDHPVLAGGLVGSPVGTTDDALVIVEYGDEGSADVRSFDPISGTAALLASSDGYVSVGLSANGSVVVSGFTAIDVTTGAWVTVLEPPNDDYYVDLDW